MATPFFSSPVLIMRSGLLGIDGRRVEQWRGRADRRRHGWWIEPDRSRPSRRSRLGTGAGARPRLRLELVAVVQCPDPDLVLDRIDLAPGQARLQLLDRGRLATR